jgi:site-specific DNA-methyltransferase (adenine-specific)
VPVYYSDDLVTLYHGDSLEVLPTLDVQAAALLTDPPYFKVKQDAWDNQWGGADEFLGWMGSWLDVAKPLLTANASAWVFASPAMTSSVERVVGEHFRILNSIRWIKQAGWHQKSELAALRSFLSPWEGIIFAEQIGADGSALRGSGWADACAKLHAGVFEPLREYMLAERNAAGQTNRTVDAHLGTNGMAGHYFGGSQWALPTEAVFDKLREIIPFRRDYEDLRRDYEDLRRDYEDLRRDYEDLRRDYEDLRRPFTITDRALSTDVWDFPTVKPYKGKHPCEKPAEMLRHMIETSTRPGDLVLDPFAGSGSTLEAARNLGRRAVGIEQDEHWCEQIALRLSQARIDLAA